MAGKNNNDDTDKGKGSDPGKTGRDLTPEEAKKLAEKVIFEEGDK